MATPPLINGWTVLAHPCFLSQFKDFLADFKESRQKYPNDYKKKIPVLTLHDCIITTMENLDFVKKFMETTLNNELGFKPMLKSKIYD